MILLSFTHSLNSTNNIHSSFPKHIHSTIPQIANFALTHYLSISFKSPSSSSSSSSKFISWPRLQFNLLGVNYQKRRSITQAIYDPTYDCHIIICTHVNTLQGTSSFSFFSSGMHCPPSFLLSFPVLNVCLSVSLPCSATSLQEELLMRFITYFSTSPTPPGMVMTGYSAAAEDDINDGRKEKEKPTELSRRRNPEARSYKNSGQCFNLSPLSCGSNPFCKTQANQPARPVTRASQTPSPHHSL